MIKLADIARETGFSTCTVSKVLNGGRGADRYSPECRKKVTQTAERMGYHRNFAGRALRRGRTDTIGVLLPDWTSYGLMDPFMAAILGSVESAVRLQGLQTLILASGDVEKLGATLRENRADGLIACSFHEYPALTAVLEDSGLPAIRLFGKPGGGLPAVGLDEAAGVAAAVDHLADLGHRTVVWVGPERPDESGPIVRKKGFEKTAKSRGLQMRYLYTNPVSKRDLVGEIEAYRDAVIREGADYWRGASAAVCYHDPTAFGVLDGLRKLGVSVPEHVSVVGFDNVVATLASPPLTSVDFMLRQTTDAAVTALLGWLESGEKPAEHLLITPVLHIGKSTGPAPTE